MEAHRGEQQQRRACRVRAPAPRQDQEETRRLREQERQQDEKVEVVFIPGSVVLFGSVFDFSKVI